MCFDLESRPPIVPVAGGALDSEWLALEAADGSPLSAFRARAAEPTGTGMLILPDGRGLERYYETLALRVAEAGIDALAIDYYGRTAGPAPRGAGFEHLAHLEQTRWANLTADIELAAARLRRDGAIRRLFAIGFCFGGRLAFLSATLSLDLAGVIGFYGWPVGPKYNDSPAPADVARLMTAPVLGLFGGGDEGISAEDVATFERALSAAGVGHEIVTYPGAPHGFFHRGAPEFAEASRDAWSRVLEFVHRGSR